MRLEANESTDSNKTVARLHELTNEGKSFSILPVFSLFIEVPFEVFERQEKAVRALIELGANVNAESMLKRTPLHVAASGGKLLKNLQSKQTCFSELLTVTCVIDMLGYIHSIFQLRC